MRRWRIWPGPRACTRTYVSRVLRLTLLAPEIVEAILDGRQPAELQLDDLLEGFPLEWTQQTKCRDVQVSSARIWSWPSLTKTGQADCATTMI